MSKLVLLAFGGRITDGTSAGSPEVEIWSNSLSFLAGDAYDYPSVLSATSSALQAWFGDPDTKIHNTVTLDYVKLNEYSVLTGHQLTDPTIETMLSPPIRGGSSSAPPATTQSYRISMDNGTRNRRTRGGFYVPRTTCVVEQGGRYSPANVTAMLGTASTLFAALQDPPLFQAAVWSRAGKIVTPITRIRIGDVPDNVRRRKNGLREAYQNASA